MVYGDINLSSDITQYALQPTISPPTLAVQGPVRDNDIVRAVVLFVLGRSPRAKHVSRTSWLVVRVLISAQSRCIAARDLALQNTRRMPSARDAHLAQVHHQIEVPSSFTCQVLAP